MIKKLLAYALIGVLALETPATALASEVSVVETETETEAQTLEEETQAAETETETTEETEAEETETAAETAETETEETKAAETETFSDETVEKTFSDETVEETEAAETETFSDETVEETEAEENDVQEEESATEADGDAEDSDEETTDPLSVTATCADHSITLTVTKNDSYSGNSNYIYIYYAPTDDLDNENYRSYWFGSSGGTIPSLLSGTEYTFYFCDYGKSTIYMTKTFSTTGEQQTANVTYSAELSEDFLTLTLTAKAELSGFSASDTGSVSLHYQYDDEERTLNASTSKYLSYIVSEDYTSLEFTYDITRASFIAGNTYDVTMYLYFGSAYITTPETTVQVTMGEALKEDVTLELSQNETTETTVDYTLTLPSESESYRYVYLYYRTENSVSSYDDYESVYVSAGQTTATGTITGLAAGNTYDFCMYYGGVKTTKTVTLEQTTGIALQLVEDGTNEVGAYQATRTYKAVLLDDTELKDTYYLYTYIYQGGSYTSLGSNTLTSENDYQATVSTADFSSSYAWLAPDTDVYLKWVLSTSSSSYYATSSSYVKATVYETLHTEKADVTFETEGVSQAKETVTVTLAAEDVAGMSISKYLYVYVKKSEESDYPSSYTNYMSLNSSNEYSNSFTLTGLESSTEYELSLQDSDGVEYATTTFTTLEDTRVVKATVAAVGRTTATLSYTLSGLYTGDSGYALIYIKKSGDEEWTKSNSKSYSNTDTVSSFFYLSGLEAGETYAYIIGFGEYSTAVEDLKNAAEGSFTTKADERTLTIEPTVSRTTAYLYYTISNTFERDYGYVLLFTRKSGDEEWTKFSSYKSYSASSDTVTNYYFSLTGLDVGGTYEYTVGFSDSPYYVTSVEDLERTTTGSFKTLTDERTLTVDTTAGRKSATLSYTIGNTFEGDYGYVVLFTRASGEEDWTKKDYDYYNASSDTVSGTSYYFYLSGLDVGGTYEYTVGFSDLSSYYVTSVEDLERTVTGSFTTRADERTLSIETTVTRTTAKLSYTISNTFDGDSGYLVLYLKKSGTEDAWERYDYNYYSASSDTVSGTYYYFRVTGLDVAATYEYTMGFVDTWSEAYGSSASIDNLAQATTGTFTTKADERTITASVSPKCTTAYFYYTINNTESGDEGYVIVYVRKSGETEWTYGGSDWYYADSDSVSGSDYYVSISDLTEETDYEYFIGLGDSSNTAKDDLSKTSEGTFTTLADQRKLSDDSTTVSETKASALVKAYFSGNIESEYTEIYFYYKLSTATEWTYYDSIYTNSESRYVSKTISGLASETAYDYAITIGGAPEDVTRDGWKLTGSFTTSKVTAPTTIALSESEIYLNAAYSGTSGYGQRTLTVINTPETAAKGYTVESSDTAVAKAYVSNGKLTVTAVGAGDATITVTSSYNAEATAAVTVHVASYSAAYDGSSSVTKAKGDTLELSGLTVTDNSTGETLDASAYSVTSGNASVVSVSGDTATAEGKGSTKLIVTVGDYKAYITWTTTLAAKGYDILGLTNSSYPAIDYGTYSYGLAAGYKYYVNGEVSPSGSFDRSDFEWKSSDESVATVSDGTITAVAAGTATITVTPTEDSGFTGEKTLTITVLEMPEDTTVTLYALTNLASTLRDVALPDGWTWVEDLDTAIPAVINGVNTSSYPFKAVYDKSGAYPLETTVNVYFANVYGMSVTAVDKNGDSCDVVETVSGSGEDDALTLTVKTNNYGTLNTEGYDEYTVSVADVDGLTITPGDMTTKGVRTFTITATKAGKYTLKPTITVKDADGNTKTLATASYTVEAVDGKQAYTITLTPDESILGDKITYSGSTLVMDSADDDAPESFSVTALVKDRLGNELSDTELTWTTSDKTVATVDPSDTHTATVTMQGEGHVIITATAKDTAGRSAAMQIELQNHAPRVNTSTATVNTAYDYSVWAGRYLGYYSSGKIEIVPVYSESVTGVEIYENGTKSDTLWAENYSGNWWVICADKEVSTGKHNCTMKVTTAYSSTPYEYDLTVNSVYKRATVKAKAVKTANLFYLTDTAVLGITVSGALYSAPTVAWEDSSSGTGNGFALSSTTASYDSDYKSYVAKFTQESIALDAKHKLADTGIASGTLTVTLEGYREPYTISNAAIKWSYKKPTITTSASSTTIAPTAGVNSRTFYLYNKTDSTKTERIYMSYSSYDSSSKYCYSSYECGNNNVTVSPSSSSVTYTYNGSKTSGSEKLTLTLYSDYWREPLTVTHTVKIVKPQAYLSNSNVTINTTQIGSVSRYIYLKNTSSISYDDVEITGKDAKAQALLDEDLLTITGSGNTVTVKQNRASALGSEIKAGTYTYNITPYYTDAGGNRQTLNTLALKVKVVNKAITAKTSAKGTLDLTNYYAYSGSYGNYITLTTKFANIGNSYSVTDYELIGEYSDYFDISLDSYNSTTNNSVCRLYLSDYGQLKAGQSYKLAVKYTIKMTGGDTFTVTGNTFTVKPKQTAAKVTVTNDNQTLYAAANNVSRTYTLSVPSGYSISYAYGTLDCNKDGTSDIIVSGYGSSVTVKINDRDGVLATAKGKTYTIPVTVRLTGRDGISKDVTTKIKVTVKK